MTRSHPFRSAAARGIACLSLAAVALQWWPIAAQAPAESPEGETAEASASPRDLVETGRYEEAVALLEPLLEEGAAPASSVRVLAEAQRALGQYRQAAETLEGALASSPDLTTSLGEIKVLLGEREAAETLFERAIAQRHGDALMAQVHLAQLWLERGELERAEEGFYRLIDAYNQRETLSARDLVAVGMACQALGRDNPQLFKDALKAYDEAIETSPSYLLPRVLIGALFVEKYDSTQARDSLRDVLEVNPRHPEANLAFAELLHFDGSSQALEVARSILEVNPNLIEARVLIARLLLELEQFEEAQTEAERALEVDPGSLEALSALAASYYLRDDLESYEQTRTKVLELNPRYADFYNALADAALRTANYPRARDLARQAVEIDPKSWRGWHHLGLNQLRLGEIEEGTRNLEKAFEGDPYNVWVKNTLDLTDTFSEYDTIPMGRFELFLHRDEAEALAPWMGELAEEAYSELAKRYRFEPPTPIRIEAFPSHADFSVRTVGLAGLGALGVCFGPVLVVDSPSARSLGEANWGSTLWHELAHTFTLELTEARVPRWLTEGISVFEERRARQGWADDVTPDFLQALAEDKLLPMAELNNGFVRPSFPMQIVFSYYQGSLVVERIVEQWGFEKLLEMLHAYRDGLGTEEVFRTVLEIELEDFDEGFFAGLEQRFEVPLASITELEEEPQFPGSREEMVQRIEKEAGEHPESFRAQLAWGTVLYGEERYEEAIEYLERARGLFPQYASQSSPYALLGEIYRKRGETEKAIERFRQLIDIDETAWQGHLSLAELLAEQDRPEEAAEVLLRAIYISPFQRELFDELAELALAAENPQLRVRALESLVSLDPPDRAQALYRLAEAHLDAGSKREARRAVLRALEIAPGYDEAQDLLLRLVEESSS